MRFIVPFADYLCFRFVGSLIVGFAIGGAVSMGGDIAVSLLGFLW